MLKEDDWLVRLVGIVPPVGDAVQGEDVAVLCHDCVDLSRVALGTDHLVRGQVVAGVGGYHSPGF